MCTLGADPYEVSQHRMRPLILPNFICLTLSCCSRNLSLAWFGSWAECAGGCDGQQYFRPLPQNVPGAPGLSFRVAGFSAPRFVVALSLCKHLASPCGLCAVLSGSAVGDGCLHRRRSAETVVLLCRTCSNLACVLLATESLGSDHNCCLWPCTERR